MPTRPLVACALAIALAGCTGAGGGPGPSGSGTDAQASRSAPFVSPIASTGVPGGSAFPASVLEPILADAARRTGVAASDLRIVTAEPKTWPDGSWGCPQPGIAYTQIVVDGYQVVVQAAGRTLDYRGAGPGQFRLCEKLEASPS
jgi:hypothetical protein